MNQKTKRGWREAILLTAPVLALACWSLWTQARAPQIQQPFSLTIAAIEVSTPVKSRMVTNELDKRPVAVDVFIGHKGPTPSWWGRGMNPSHFRVHFTAAGKKDLHNENVGASNGVSWDESREQYLIHHSGRIPKTQGFLKGATCHVSVELESQTPPFAKMATAKASIPMDALNP